MLQDTKDRLSELGIAVWGSILFLVILGTLTLGTLAFQQVVYPWWLSIQRMSVEHSKSFTDANNNMLETYKLEYARLETKIAEAQGPDTESIVAAYTAQQKAIVTKICTQISTMQKDTVNPDTLLWLNSKGGCR